MNKSSFLFDTHALIFWASRVNVPEKFIKFFDLQEELGRLYISSISFWEISLLVKKGKINLPDVHAWKNEILANTNVQLIDPGAGEMIDSSLLPDIHKDPFDRLLISQAIHNKLVFVTKDEQIKKYDVATIWNVPV